MTIPPTAVLFAVMAGSVLLLHPNIPDAGRAVFGVMPPGACRMYESAAHVLVFLTMTSALLLWSGPSRVRRWSASGAAAIYSMATEFAQSWTPGRSVDPGDGLCNLAGVAIAVAAINWFDPHIKEESPRFQRSDFNSETEFGT